ncbi:MAG: WYL domain-containing protein [Planctomycetaceae bacterium]|nr:WYL domain-containing protein [Planctomycetaceae bacterium]
MSDSIQLLRQWTLLRLLAARRQGLPLKDLANELGVSQKTILRDLNLLRRLAFPVEETVGERGRKTWRLVSDEGLPNLRFTLEEAAALYLGRQYLEGLAGTMFWSGAQSAFQKIRAAFGEPALRHLQKLATGFYLTTHALVDYEERGSLIDDLMIAIEDRKLTVITYQSLRSTEPVTHYDIHPYALVHHRGALYVIAWSNDHHEIRTFKVDRITSATLHDLQFERPKDFTAADHLAHSFGIFAGDGPSRRVLVRFSGQVTRILEEKRFHPSQRITRDRDGSLLAEYQLSSFEEFTSWLLSFGPLAEVLEPVELRQALVEALSQSLDMYNKQVDSGDLPQQQPVRTRRAK